MILLEVLERSLCTDPNCFNCKGIRRLTESARAKFKEREAKADADVAQKPTDAPTPKASQPADPFSIQQRIIDRARRLSEKANALHSLATTVPGLTDDAKEGLRLILDGELMAGPF